MAAGRFGDITRCSICLDTYKEPKALPCIHTFCLECLNKHCEDKEQEELKCPLCRHVFSIPPGGNRNLPNNMHILQLLDPTQNQPTSDVNVEHTQEERALAFSYCDEHTDHVTSLYCYDCKTVICQVCIANNHKKHDLIDVNHSAFKFREQLQVDVDCVSARASEKQDCIKQLEVAMKHFEEKITTTQNEISQKYEQIINVLLSHQHRLEDELNKFKKKILKEFETVKGKEENEFVIRESFNMHCLEMMNKGTACAISRAAPDLHTRAEELVKAQDEHDYDRLSEIEITFKPSPLTKDIVGNFIGELVFREERVSTEDTQKGDLSRCLEKLSVHHVMGSLGLPISGLTVLGNDVFVVRNISLVFVYNSDDFSFQNNLNIIQSKKLKEIVSCSYYNCLYATDPGQNNIYRHDLNENVTTNWLVRGIVHRLSVTKTYNVLATSYCKSRIQEHNTNGCLIRNISLDSSIDHPWHCVQLSTGNYVVCHDGNKHHRVCIIDQNGRIILSYGGSQGSGIRQLHKVSHLAVCQLGYVLIADYGNNRIQLLSPTLTHLDDIVIPGYQLNYASTFHFDGLTRRLYIGEWKNGRVFVMNV